MAAFVFLSLSYLAPYNFFQVHSFTLNLRISFVFMDKENSTVCVCSIFIVHSSANRHIDGVNSLAIVDKATMNTTEQDLCSTIQSP